MESAPDAIVSSGVLSPAHEVMEINSSGSGESEAEEKEVSIHGSRDVPIRAVKFLPSRADRTVKGSARSVPTYDADATESALEQLRADNEHLESIIRGMRQNASNQQSRLITFSNQIYAMSREIYQLDSELGNLD